MRAYVLGLAASVLVAVGLSPAAAEAARGAQAAVSPQRALANALRGGMSQLGRFSGAIVVDLDTGATLFASAPDVGRLPASVEKLYTTSAALLEFGPTATLSTTLLGVGRRDSTGVWHGALYLRGGGDPTFGSAAYDAATYGGGATVQRLVASLQRRAHLHRLAGRIVGDATYFDDQPGTIESGFTWDPYMEGSLSALAFNRGVVNQGAGYVTNPSIYAAGQLAGALRGAHVRLPAHLHLRAGRTPPSARVLAVVRSPSLARLIALTNTPSDNFFAEMLTKGLGARFGQGGTTADGVAVIHSVLAAHFALSPAFDDGSGLSRDDSSTPRQVVTLLTQMAGNRDFVASLAVAGETGTLQYEMQGTAAQGRCQGKTGTLHDVASLAGYCQAADGHRLVFAFLANALGDPIQGHAIEASMTAALANYDG